MLLRRTHQKIYNFIPLKAPRTPAGWQSIAEGFYRRWNFPNCVGAIDGKHIRIRAPANSGTDYYNYKGYSSLVLLAVVDHDYKFIFADVGAHGRCSDAGVWRESTFNQVSIKINADNL